MFCTSSRILPLKYTSGSILSIIPCSGPQAVRSVRFSSSNSHPDEKVKVVAAARTSETRSSGTNSSNDSKAASKKQKKRESVKHNKIRKQASLAFSPATDSQSLSMDMGSKSRVSSFPRVPNTSNIDKEDLCLDILFSGYRPLRLPLIRSKVGMTAQDYQNQGESEFPLMHQTGARFWADNKADNLPGSLLKKRKQSSTIKNDMEKYREVSKKQLKEEKYYQDGIRRRRTPIFTVFTNSALDTQQHDLELFNLPLKVVEDLRPFEPTNQPGHELYRDDIIYVRKYEAEERESQRREKLRRKYERDLKLAKKGKKRIVIEDPEIFFGYK